MKAHDLAKALLKMPDIDVYFHDEYNDEEKTVIKIADGFKCTPDGLFLQQSTEFGFISDDIKVPNEHPQLGTMRMFFVDDTITSTKIGTFTYHVGLLDYSLSWNRTPEPNLVFIPDDDENSADYKFYKQVNSNTVIKTPKDIVKISVLTDFDESTWYETYTDMTFDEALEYAQELYPRGFYNRSAFTDDAPDTEFEIKVSTETLNAIKDSE